MSYHSHKTFLFASVAVAAPALLLGNVGDALTSFTNGDVADADQINANFVALAQAIDGSTAHKENSAAVDPTASNDSDEGYARGSLWFNTATSTAFMCVNAQPGGAEWVEIAQAPPKKSCNDLLLANPSLAGQDAVYQISPEGTPIDAYCDMTTDEGGWTLVVRGEDNGNHLTTAAINETAVSDNNVRAKYADTTIEAMDPSELHIECGDNASQLNSQHYYVQLNRPTAPYQTSGSIANTPEDDGLAFKFTYAGTYTDITSSTGGNYAYSALNGTEPLLYSTTDYDLGACHYDGLSGDGVYYTTNLWWVR